jgi:uncharacterized protein (TIGR02996 family)
MLDEREAFLRAIFDNPADDLPRLVHADWLEEHGEAELAAGIRLACERAGLPEHDVIDRGRLAAEGFNLFRRLGRSGDAALNRGFAPSDTIAVSAGLLADADKFRRTAAVDHPEWFGADRLRITGGRIVGAVQIETLFAAPAAARVTRLDLRGVEEDAPVKYSALETSWVNLIETEFHPVITVLGVEALVSHRGARRLTELRLSNNDLDNDAARLLVRSPYLTRLTRLDILRGNRLHGKTWAQLRERFGEDVLTTPDTETHD